MDKYEYRIRAEEISDLIEKKEYVEAVKIADTIDWRRVRSVVMLCKVSELYKINRRYEDSKEILLMAYELQNKSRKIIYSLCELSIKLEETVQAVEYYKEFIKVAPRDTGRFILQYRLYEAQDVSLEERIAVLEEYKKRDYREKWAYELAYLYHRIGLETRCVEECDELVLWFREGKYVIKALELKRLHAPLDPQQQEIYNSRFMVPAPEEAPAEEAAPQEVEPALSIEIKSVEVTKAKTAEIPSKKVNDEIETAPTLEIPREEIAEEVSTTEDETEEAEETGVTEPDDFDIQVKTIDVGDEYSTINLQEELARNLAEMLAQEDMEAMDATRALPIDSIFEATSQNLSVENIENLPLQDEVVNEVISIENMEEKDIPEESADIEETEETLEETLEVIEETEELEEAPEEVPEEDEEVTEEISEEIPEEVEEVIEEISEEFPEEVPEAVEEISEVIEEPDEIPTVAPVPTVEPLLFGENQQLPEAVIQALQNVAMEAAKEAAKQAAAEAAKQAAAEAAQATAEVMKEMKPEQPTVPEMENAEETEQQVPQEQVEKQITGQLSFSDIMAEWEETKKANEEKHLQEMKQRVMEQTGPLFSDFDAAARASVQSDLDLINPPLDVFSDSDELATEVEAALMEETMEEKEEETLVVEEEIPVVEEEILTIEEEIPTIEEATSTIEKVISPIEEETSVVMEEIPLVTEEPISAAETPAIEVPVAEVPATETRSAAENAALMAAVKAAQAMAAKAEESSKVSEEEETEDRPSSFNTEEIIGLEEKLMGALESQHYNTADLQAKVLETEMSSEKPAEPRTLTMEEKTLFGSIAPTKELQEKVAGVLDSISLLPYKGNVIIVGEKGTDTQSMAKNIVRHLAQNNHAFSGKTQFASPEEFNGKDIYVVVNQLCNGALIIQNAGEMSADLCNKLMKAGNAIENGGIVYILIDDKSGVERLSRSYPKVFESFDLMLDMSVMDNDSLVKFGKEYAKEKDYSIDDMGVLALYNRIEERQTSEHSVTIEEVKELVDMAIENAEKKGFSKFAGKLLGKRYDSEDRVVLREKDFMMN